MGLQGKKILLGITGGIAAYKAAILVRLLIKEGAEVKVVMTPSAKQFITPLTLATLSKNPILTEFFNPENGAWNSHVDLGLWADLYLIAPATANSLAKMAHGIADNLLLTTYLSIRCPVLVAPAMDLDMFSHPANLQNLEILRKRGVTIVEPTSGELASGLDGKGRMEEPENILRAVNTIFLAKTPAELTGKNILVSAGPTYESIDPVRYIGNYSSGKMGYALAEELAARGAAVTLVSGPVSIKPVHPGIKLIKVQSAQQMYESCVSIFTAMDAAILAAAVADFTPVATSDQKIKREKEILSLQLKPTEDIAARLGEIKKPDQVLVGFALETSNEMQHAQNKLARKNFDFIVLNSLQDEGAGFQVDTNKITIIDKDHQVDPYPIKPKTLVAKDIVDKLVVVLHNKLSEK
jgi:phosphopantothenoylcysteine decarboxylase/phosphopantothenate--cysteine ligase